MKRLLLICLATTMLCGTSFAWSAREHATVAVQSPWACGANYSIGTIGENWIGFRKERPQGVWISHGTHVAPQSLYEAQLLYRKKTQPGGVFDVK